MLELIKIDTFNYLLENLFSFKSPDKLIKWVRQNYAELAFEYALTSLQIPLASVIVFENEKTEINAAIHAGIPQENIFRI